MSMLAEAAALLADPVAAASLYEPLLPWAALNAVDVAEGFRGAVSRYLGLLAATTGRLDDAARHFEQAVAMNAHMGARPWLAATQRDYGRLLLARGRPGDRERGRELLRRADAIYRELGLNDEPGR
jgi:tetratricopeptide (TPR) repeat protein